MKVIFVLFFCFLLDATEVTIVGVIKPVLAKEWGINHFEQAMIGTSIFLGW